MPQPNLYIPSRSEDLGFVRIDKKSFASKIWLIPVLWLLCFCWVTGFATPAEDTALATTAASSVSAQNALTAVKQQYQLTLDRNNISADALLRLKRDKTEAINQSATLMIDKNLLNRADLEVALANSNVDGADLAQAEAQQAADTVVARINNLANQLQTVMLAAGKTSAVKARIASMQNELNTQKEILKWQNRLVQTLTTSQDLAKQRYLILQTWRDQLYNIYQVRQKHRKDQALQMIEDNLQQQQRQWLQRLADFNIQIAKLNPNDPSDLTLRSTLDLQILEAQEQINLLRLQTVVLRLMAGSNELFEPLPLDPTVQLLKNRLNNENTALFELDNLKNLVTQKITLLQKRAKIESNAKLIEENQQYNWNTNLIQGLLTKYEQSLISITDLQNKIVTHQLLVQQALNKALARRQGLPGFNLIAWQELAQQIMTMPALASKAGVALKDQIVISASKLTLSMWFILLLTECIWLWLWLNVRRSLLSMLATCCMSDQKQVDKSRYVLLLLSKRNLISLYGFIGLGIAFWMMGLSLTTFAPLIYLLLVWFIFKFALGLARIILLENVNTSSGGDVKLYRELYWALIAGGLVTMLMVLAHQLPVGYEVADFFNRLFMVFLLVTALVLLRNWRVAPMLLAPYTQDKRPYLHKVVWLLALLVPLIILSTAVIGLLGYVDFAWTLSKYEGLLLLVMTGYIVTRGLLKDVIDGVSTLLIGRLQHGWLWRQAFLKPIDKIIRLGLFFAAGAILFWLYGWDKNSLAFKKLVDLLHMHLIDTKGLSLTVENLLSLIIAGLVVRWVTKWSREFAFRWLYHKQKDIGARTSLATLTQYLVFLCSTFLALKIIGVDLSGISYVLAGFAAGVGLGLRDIIKNYASGLLLLFERPVKTGDMVTIGDFEGEVTHMGMRAITIKTSDHMQVLMPNSETFEKPFTNWTYLDTIVRTVIVLKIVREDDPHHVRALILEVLQKMPVVLGDPAPQIYLVNMDDALLEFEVRYFINMQQGKTRTEIRSDVLFNLFETFKVHQIHTPYPQQDIVVRNLPMPT